MFEAQILQPISIQRLSRRAVLKRPIPCSPFRGLNSTGNGKHAGVVRTEGTSTGTPTVDIQVARLYGVELVGLVRRRNADCTAAAAGGLKIEMRGRVGRRTGNKRSDAFAKRCRASSPARSGKCKGGIGWLKGVIFGLHGVKGFCRTAWNASEHRHPSLLAPLCFPSATPPVCRLTLSLGSLISRSDSRWRRIMLFLSAPCRARMLAVVGRGMR
jgi:hypothetical protein